MVLNKNGFLFFLANIGISWVSIHSFLIRRFSLRTFNLLLRIYQLSKVGNFHFTLFILILWLTYRVRVANELGAGNGKAAKFATKVAVVTSVIIGLFFWVLIMIFHTEIGYIFTNSIPVITEVNKLSLLLAFTILLNSVQPILSGSVHDLSNTKQVFSQLFLF